MLKIPATPAEWAAIVPNAVDLAIAREGWKAGHAGGHSIRARVAAASRLLAEERCVERLAKELERYAFSDPRAEARRILGCEPESPDAYFRADYASNRREARRGLVGEPESKEESDGKND